MAPTPHLSLPFSGAKAREKRQRLGLSLDKVAARCAELGHSVHFTNIGRIERGEHMPSAALLLVLAEALKCTSIDDLLDEVAA
ncbi:helix-turn-helix domain-containing protein [Kibdelosporangium philippinense]|uniref:Helix-turn-helix domain-containing protein n=1 Tax=Kibdelosporangium philippinense TaxID=211113 RepID=A0ABS8ZQL9_9PSEU|nr:helix-turn-helix transcriptional regulator [Kibdelosporangium philippinense]MCE7008763.1 helix-turn-helix domain-containing protein [Kibdelosporangium philippinense]